MCASPSARRDGDALVSWDGSPTTCIVGDLCRISGLVRERFGRGCTIRQRTGNHRKDRLTSRVDQIVRAYLERQGAKRPLSLMERVLANTFGASIADALVGKMLTEETLTKILRDGVVEGLPDAQMPTLAGLDVSNTFKILRRLSPVKIVEFEIALGNDASSGAISLHFDGNGWKLSGVNLPAKAVRALAETLPIK